jgi:hypothetical protein
MSAKTKSERTRRLISHGYFAPELPPCFVSDDLARHRRSILAGINALPLAPRGLPNYHAFISEPAWFYFPRFGREDRRHGVPNPIAHLLLSRALADNYVDLRRKARASKITLSPPVFDWSGSRALMRTSVDSRDNFRVHLASRREEYVAADIRSFYHSIYTHAIPWAIHGKPFAKRHRDMTHYGNLLDLLCRNAQDGQTLGLPVGPDTSRLIAEIVVSAVDVNLQRHLKIGARDASRYVDDYTLSSPNGANGEELLAALRQTAATFELELNSNKSSIYPTSYRQNTGWQEAVRAHLPRPSVPGGRVEASAVQHLLYQLGRLCIVHPDINVEKFGIQNARSALIMADDWSALQLSLISAYRRNSSLLPLLVEVCLLRQVAHGDVQTDILTEFIENRLPVLARANRTGEIVWLLFMAIRLGLRLSALQLAAVFPIENALIALLVVCLDHRNLVQGNVDRRLWDRSLTTGGLRSPMWLYAYEAATQGFIPGFNDNFITQDPYFGLLRAKRVQFFDVARGYDSMSTTLRRLRNENTRRRRLREAIQEENFDEFDELDEGEDESDGSDDDDNY